MKKDQFSEGMLLEVESVEFVQTFSNADLRQAIIETVATIKQLPFTPLVAGEHADEVRALLVTHLDELLKIERMRAGIIGSVTGSPVAGGTVVINNHG